MMMVLALNVTRTTSESENIISKEHNMMSRKQDIISNEHDIISNELELISIEKQIMWCSNIIWFCQDHLGLSLFSQNHLGPRRHFCLFGVLCWFQHYIGHTMTGSSKGRGNQ